MSRRRIRSRVRKLASFVLVVIATTAGAGPASVKALAVRTFYVDCANGADGASGASESAAWKTVGRANDAALNPGDSLLFKRGCTWTGTALDAGWNGTADAPITIATYGSDATRPRIADAGIIVTGDY